MHYLDLLHQTHFYFVKHVPFILAQICEKKKPLKLILPQDLNWDFVKICLTEAKAQIKLRLNNQIKKWALLNSFVISLKNNTLQ